MSFTDLVNKKPIGNSGSTIFSGTHSDDHITTLQGYLAAAVYNKMRRSEPQVRKVLNGLLAPIKAAKWSIEPVSDDKKDLEVAALIERILFEDIDFEKFQHEALLAPVHGHSVFEPVHANKTDKEFGEYTGLAQIGFRNQETLIEWKHDHTTGALEKIHQVVTGDLDLDVWLPAENLLIFYMEQEGDNNGTALLRSLYGPYTRKLLAKELQYIGMERFSVGTPRLKIPSKWTANSEEYKAAAAVLAAFTSAEDSFIIYPEDCELFLDANGNFDPEKIQKVIKSEDEEMAGAWLLSFLELGVGGNSGAFALGKDLSEFLFNVISMLANGFAKPVNRELIPNLVRLNYGDTISVMPKLTSMGITDKAGEELMKVITGYTKAGVITKDELLEDSVRKAHDLPKKAEGTAVENQEGAGGTSEEGSAGDNGSDPPSSTPPSDEGSASRTDVEMADKAKTPVSLITMRSKAVSALMRDQLRFISDKYIADVMRKYKTLPANGKLKAIDDIKVGGKAKYKKELKALLTSISVEALDQARSEIPSKQNVKLKDIERLIKFRMRGLKDIKLNDFSKLPKHTQLLLNREVEHIVERQSEDLTDRVAFQFMGSESSTNDPALIKKDLDDTADKYITQGTVDTAAGNVTAVMINDSRNNFFFDKEVLEEIQSFTFMNADPQSEICKTLAGQTFATNDAEFLRYEPPLHHNCKSILRANLKTSKGQPTIEPVPPISKAARKSITLSEGCCNARH